MHVAGSLSKGDKKRFQKALSEAIDTAAQPPRQPLRHPVDAMKRQWSGWKMRNRLESVVSPADLIPATLTAEGPGESWRDRLASAFETEATNGLRSTSEKEKVAWIAACGELDAATWGIRVQQGLESRMATDPKLRPLLARLDWTNEQEFRSVATFALMEFQHILRLALTVFVAILFALAAIAVILAVNL